MKNENRTRLFQLVLTEGITNVQICTLLKACKRENLQLCDLNGFEIAQFANLSTSKAKFLFHWANRKEEELAQKQQEHSFLTILDEKYPPLLNEMYAPPVVLFYEGNLNLLWKNCLSVVGSRLPSEFGVQSIRKIVTPLVKDFVIVSGLAAGIDGIAHKVAIASGGQTIGVIGCGLDVFYPKHHEKLQKEMMKKHLVLSEYPNGTPPRRHQFPERNRIIAGLSMGTVVVEAKLRSGSLITCEFALDYGREVYAVPGEILSGRSDGCHHLIQEGAKCIFDVRDILEDVL